jgi:hypothetical protein
VTTEPVDVIYVDNLVAVTGTIVWLALVIFQLADFGASVLDERTSSFGANSRFSSQRFADYFWAPPLLAFAALGTVLGAYYAGRLILVDNAPARGIAIFLALAGVGLFAAIGVLVLVTRRERVTYASLESTLRGASNGRPAKSEVETLRAQLAMVDARERTLRLGLGDSKSHRELRQQLEALVRRFTREPATGLQVFDAVTWRSSSRFLWTQSWWRLLPVLVALVPLSVAVVSGDLGSLFDGIPLWVLLIFPAPLSYLAAVGSAKAALAARVARRVWVERQRAEVERLLILLERGSRKGVAGLGERVTRALQILREQQG